MMSLDIINRKVSMKIETVAEGSLTADGSEQIVVDDGRGPAILSGFISLEHLQLGDSVTIRAYALVNGTYGLYGKGSYGGVQTEPMLRVNGIRYKDKMMITLQQTAGSYRGFDYEFVREV
ncbi:hypothetical protein LCGC14_1232320 [marine sediment metagenome]|uniref:Uncharacterized protein n=1 Tax=marine sediment metagenome TaxID=412755 RepID=A0A0F9L8A0_9ZZZZ